LRAIAVLLSLLTIGCGDEPPFSPARSVRLQFEVTGLPDGGSAEYRIFVQDTVPIAHGRVGNSESDTVRISSSAALRVRWQDARVRVGEADYIFGPAQREVLVDESETDTTMVMGGSYALASGGFILNAPGVPVQTWAYWQAWNEDDSVVAGGPLRAGEVVRRGDLPPGHTRLQLDTIQVELDGLFHDYAPPQRLVPLSISASLDLISVNAPYSLVSVAVRVSPSGLPPGTHAPWAISSSSENFGFSSSTLTDTVWTLDRIAPDTYTVEWGEVIVDGLTYRPDPATDSATLTPSLEPYEFPALYAAVP
jgi:hypothetical protein